MENEVLKNNLRGKFIVLNGPDMNIMTSTQVQGVQWLSLRVK